MIPILQDREWTNPADLFPSIAGFAALCARRLADEYVAEFWASQLYGSILFCRNSRSTSTSPQERVEALQNRRPFVAPSWCWATDMAGCNPASWSSYPHSVPAYKTLRPHMIYEDDGPEARYGRIGEASCLELTTRFLRFPEDLLRDERVGVEINKNIHDSTGNARILTLREMEVNFELLDWNEEPAGFNMEGARGLAMVSVASACRFPEKFCVYHRRGDEREKGSGTDWGLLIYPCGKFVQGKGEYYYRVGLCSSQWSIIPSQRTSSRRLFEKANVGTFWIK